LKNSASSLADHYVTNKPYRINDMIMPVKLKTNQKLPQNKNLP